MRIFLRICLSVFLTIGLYTIGHTDEHFPFLAQVSKKSVNVRAGDNTNFEKLDKLNQGTQVVVLGRSFDWYKVQLPTTAKAYIRADYLKIVQNLTAQLTGNNVNIRATANSESTSLGLLKKGDLVKVIVQTNGWWQIDPPSQAVGWIRQDFLSVKSLTVAPSLIKGPVVLQEEPPAKIKKTTLSIINTKGQLIPLIGSKADVRYELLVDGKPAYYLQSVPDIEPFKGAMVVIKGLLVTGKEHQYDHPVLQVITISLCL